MSEHHKADKENKSDCTMCRFVFYFSFAVLLLTLIFTFVMRLKNDEVFGAISNVEFAPPRNVEWDARLTDLGRALGDADLTLVPPATASALDANFFALTSWIAPAPFDELTHGEDVVFQGGWKLPRDWVGNIYVELDKEWATSTSGLYFESIKNLTRLGASGAATGTFAFHVGPLPDGEHEAHFEFWGGEECAINTLLNARDNGVRAPACPVRTNGANDNFVSKQVYPPQAFTVKPPGAPQLEVTPNEEPALDLYIGSGGRMSRSFRVKNTGGTALTGSVSGFAAPFRCGGASCDYELRPGKSAVLYVEFAPQNPGVFSNTLTFSCTGDELSCVAPSVTRAIWGHANGVSRAIQ